MLDVNNKSNCSQCFTVLCILFFSGISAGEEKHCTATNLSMSNATLSSRIRRNCEFFFHKEEKFFACEEKFFACEGKNISSVIYRLVRLRSSVFQV